MYINTGPGLFICSFGESQFCEKPKISISVAVQSKAERERERRKDLKFIKKKKKRAFLGGDFEIPLPAGEVLTVKFFFWLVNGGPISWFFQLLDSGQRSPQKEPHIPGFSLFLSLFVCLCVHKNLERNERWMRILGGDYLLCVVLNYLLVILDRGFSLILVDCLSNGLKSGAF